MAAQGNGMSASLTLTHLSVKRSDSDGHAHATLHNVSLQMNAGDRIGIIGRSGAGKTTLLRVLANLERASQGQITKQPASARVMLVLQRPEHLFTQETALWEITRFVPSRNMHEARAFLDRVGFPNDLHHINPRRLSNGF